MKPLDNFFRSIESISFDLRDPREVFDGKKHSGFVSPHSIATPIADETASRIIRNKQEIQKITSSYLSSMPRSAWLATLGKLAFELGNKNKG